MSITWDDSHKKDHDPLLEQIKSFVEKHNCLAEKIAYHDTMSKLAQEYLKNNKKDPTAMNMRSHADLYVIHKRSDKTFLIDAKTCFEYRPDRNMALEAYPLSVHVEDSLFRGIKCMYVYHDPHFLDCSFGFWTDNAMVPRISHIIFPMHESERYPDETIDFLKRRFRLVFGQEIPIFYYSKPTKTGSGDPFVISLYQKYKRRPSWKDCILNYLYDRELPPSPSLLDYTHDTQH